MERGRVVLVPFPYSDLRGSKKRPACVVSTAAYNDQSPDLILAMVTSSRSRLQRPGLGDAVVQDWRKAGLRLPSTIRASRLLVVERRLLGPTLGDLTARDVKTLDGSMRTVLGL